MGLRQSIRARAVEALEAHGINPALYSDALDSYAAAREDALYLRALWDEEGRPQYALGGNGNLTTHPAIKGIQEAERLADKLGRSLGVLPTSGRAAGRQKGQSQAADRQGLRRAA